MNITKQTYNIVKNVRKRVPVKDWECTLVPHGINHKVFFPITKDHDDYEDFLKFKDTNLVNKNIDFVVLWNNRNIRRKLPVM